MSVQPVGMSGWQKRVIAERVRRGWPSATDIGKTVHGLAEEVGEFARALRKKDRDGQIDALGDIIVFCLGGLEILGTDANVVIDTILNDNESRPIRDGH